MSLEAEESRCHSYPQNQRNTTKVKEMHLDYPMKPNGMYVPSREDIEQIAHNYAHWGLKEANIEM